MGTNKLIMGKNDLQTWCKQNNKDNILFEWDYDKNEGLNPSNVNKGSSLYVWWICPLGHSYKTKIYNRTTMDNGCPYCSNHRVLSGFNDLATLNPELVSEWNYEKNYPLKPSDVLSGSSKKVWWKCDKGHEWDAIISVRSKPISGRNKVCGCPYCSNPPKRILVGFNDFESWCIKNNKAQLLQEWNYDRNTEFSPKEITFGSGKRVWWKCAKGHEWNVSPSNRVQGTNCPVCSRTQTSFPEQALAYYLSKQFRILQRYRSRGYELDILLEDYQIGIEYDGRYFHATEDKLVREIKKDEYYSSKGIHIIHIKESEYENRTDGNTIYYVCVKSNYLHSSFDGMLATLFELLESLTGLHIDIDVNVIRDELKIRKHYLSVLEENSVAHCFPELVPEWDTEKNHDMTPDIFAANSHTKVWWKCTEGHSWQAEIASRNRGLGCPYCAGQRLIEGQNDLETWCRKYSKHLLEEWDYDKNEMSPNEYTQKSHFKAWWKCKYGHEWKADIANRVNGTNCPKCNTGNNVIRGSISLEDWCNQSNNYDLLREWNYEKNNNLKPSEVSKGSHKKVWWRCGKGHEWEAQIKSRTYQHGCPYCSGTFKKAQKGVNDLVTWCKLNNKDYILDEWDYDLNGDLKPEQFTFGSHKRINWKCNNGHTWNAVIKERTKINGNRCPVCRMNN